MTTTADGASDPAGLLADLQRIVGEAHAVADPGALARLGASVAGAPAWLVVPGSAAEVAEIINLASRHAVAVVPVGKAGRSPRASSLDDRMRVFIDTRRMNHVLHLDETSLVVHVQAGLTGLGLEAILTPRGLSVGDYPPSILSSTLGGMLSVRTPGKSSARHGFVEDAVLGVSAVLADGRAIHTRVAPRRATGPDLSRALCGSEGTLGFITSVVLRIYRLPEARLLTAHALPGISEAFSAVQLALGEEAQPAAMRVYDSAEARAHLGADVCQPGEAVLVAVTAGPTDLAACDRKLIAGAAEAMSGRVLDESVAQRWWQRRMGRDKTALALLPALQVMAAPGKQAAVYHAVCAAARDAGAGTRAYGSSFTVDGAVLFFTFTDPDGHSVLGGELLGQVCERVRAAAEKAGASLLAGASPGLVPYLAELRKLLDPQGIMNPGALRD